MSNLALFKAGNIAIPAYLRASTDDVTKALAGSSGIKSISIKGGVWRLMDGSNEIAKNEERAMNIVVLAAAPKPGRTFYIGKYEEGKDQQPACWSADGDTPNAEVPAATKQSDKCATCKQNIAGSGEGDSRACRFMQRLAVALENDAEDNVYRLQLPAKSIFGKADGGKMPLQAYAKFLNGHGISVTGVVTEARFNTAEAVPVLTFAAVRPLEEAEFHKFRGMADTEDAKMAVELKITVKADAKETVQASPFKEPETPKAEKPAPKAEAAPEPDDTPVPEPTKRAKKPTPTVEEPVADKKDAADILAAWGDDDE